MGACLCPQVQGTETRHESDRNKSDLTIDLDLNPECSRVNAANLVEPSVHGLKAFLEGRGLLGSPFFKGHSIYRALYCRSN